MYSSVDSTTDLSELRQRIANGASRDEIDYLHLQLNARHMEEVKNILIKQQKDINELKERNRYLENQMNSERRIQKQDQIPEQHFTFVKVNFWKTDLLSD